MRSNFPLRIPLSKQMKASEELFVTSEAFIFTVVATSLQLRHVFLIRFKETQKSSFVNHIDS